MDRREENHRESSMSAVDLHRDISIANRLEFFPVSHSMLQLHDPRCKSMGNRLGMVRVKVVEYTEDLVLVRTMNSDVEQVREEG